MFFCRDTNISGYCPRSLKWGGDTCYIEYIYHITFNHSNTTEFQNTAGPIGIVVGCITSRKYEYYEWT